MRSSGRNTGQNRSGGRRDTRGAGGPRGEGGRRTDRPRPEERRYDQPQRDGQSGGKPSGKPGQSGGRPGGKPGQSGGRPGQAGGKPGRPKGGPQGGADSGGQGRGGRPQSGGKPKSGGPSGGKQHGPKQQGGKPGFGEKGRGGPGQRGRGRPRSVPARSREYDAQIEERNRSRQVERDRRRTPKTFAEPEGERLQKILARAGMGSRRACEELIDQARVEVNGEIVREQGLRVDPSKDEIKVDGLTVAAQSYLFFALNKPSGVVASMEDPEGRQCLGDYVQNRETRLFHVGRLDTETEGVILLTNHGELAHRLTHPRYGVKKTYLAAIQGPIPRDLGKRLKNGIPLDDGYAKADNFRVVENTGRNYLVEVTLHEGRKHIVRRMLSEAGFPVEKLVRTKFGPIALGDQKSGWLRRLTNTEVGMLMREVEL
ncbi:pseudouridine synthase [Streptomyces sulphureus]|uniref:pseudouridine synthase n=1 Tax=Streptomyces sulphureus TaxID=47758 RepID=UPI000363D9C8|nr:pseudouridine synthase [Streptomyces sulphureus]